MLDTQTIKNQIDNKIIKNNSNDKKFNTCLTHIDKNGFHFKTINNSI